MAFDEDLDSFFDLDDGAVEAVITDPADEDFEDLTINVNFGTPDEGVAVYGDTRVTAPAPTFRCKTSDLATVKQKFVVTIASNAYIIEDFKRDPGDGATSTVYLKE